MKSLLPLSPLRRPSNTFDARCIDPKETKTNKQKKVKKRMNNSTTNITRLFDHLTAGKEFTAGEIKTQLKIANPTATVSDLRSYLTKKKAIVDVYTRKRKNSKGQSVTRYGLGMARGYRDMVAPFGVSTTNQ
jgi:hypothetical protein